VELTRRTDGSLAGSVTFQSGRSFPIHLTKTVSANFEPTPVSRRAAMVLGEGNEYLAAMEALGSEAESKGRWEEAARTYMQASGAANNLAQLQGAISYAHKAVELAQRQENLSVRANAMLYLGTAYGSVGQRQKQAEWLEKALATFKLMSGGPGTDFTEPRL
jgi:tetratricopeptide (TPR) repeat protein